MFTVNDVILRLGDHTGNLDTGVVNTDQKIRAIDSAINYLKRKIGFPNDEKKYQFQYSSDVLFYDLPTGFQQPIALNYDNVNFNVPARYWDYRPYQELLTRTGVLGNRNYWSHIFANADAHQLFLLGQNINPPSTLETFDGALWTASGDASSASSDQITKIQGSASEKFTLTHLGGGSLSFGVLTSGNVGYDFRNLHELNGAFRLYYFIPSTTGLGPISIRYQSSSGNYYQINTSTQADGTAWEENDWNLLGFSTTDAAATGSPNLASITQLQLRFTTDSTYSAPQTLNRVDWLYTVIPDELDLYYYSAYKGTDATGATQKTKLTASSDIITLDDDFIEPISLRAALYLWPQLRGDATFMQMYQADFMDVIKTWARTWPKKMDANNYLRTQLRR